MKIAILREVRNSQKFLFCYYVQTQSLDDLHFPCSFHGKLVFPLLPYPFQLLYVDVVQLINICLLWLAGLLHLDRPAHYDIERSSIRHHAYIIIEHPSGMEERNGEPQHFLNDKLYFVNERMLFRLHLIIQFVFYVKSQSQRRFISLPMKSSD